MKSVERIVAIGDSIVFGRIDPEDGGWVGRLRAAFTVKAPSTNAVFNLGIGGDTTRGLVARLEGECSIRRPDLILIGIGVNDCRSEHSPNAPRAVPIEEFRANMAQIISIAAKLGKVAVLSMVPVDERRTMPTRKSLYHSLSSQEEYAEVVEAAVREAGVLLIDVFNHWRRRGRWRYSKLLEDGIHPNARGHKEIYRQVLADLKGARLLDL